MSSEAKPRVAQVSRVDNTSPVLPVPPIYVVSDGAGASGEQLVQTALAQFPENNVPVQVVGNVRAMEQLEPLVAEARQTGGFIAHTMVDARLRKSLAALARKHRVAAVDLMGPQHLSVGAGLEGRDSRCPSRSRPRSPHARQHV